MGSSEMMQGCSWPAGNPEHKVCFDQGRTLRGLRNSNTEPVNGKAGSCQPGAQNTEAVSDEKRKAQSKVLEMLLREIRNSGDFVRVI